MYKALDTTMAGISLRDKQSFWHEAVKTMLYELDMKFDGSADFRGMTESCTLGDVQWTRFKSKPVSYRRHNRHCDGGAPQILVCAPLWRPTELTQFGRSTRCEPGQLMLEYSDAPYHFQYGMENDMWTLRIPESMLKARVRNPERFCAMAFDVRSGVGKLFLGYLATVAGNRRLESDTVRAMVGAQLADLLAAVLEGDARVLQSNATSIKNAHLARIEQYLRANLAAPDLCAKTVAAACGISVRYLHLLFEDTGQTLAQWIRDHRLQLAYEALNNARAKPSISQIAYQNGFNGHAQFSSAFRKKYGCSPSDVIHRGRSRG